MVGGRGFSCAVRRRDAVMARIAKEVRRLGFGGERRLGLEEHRLPEEAGNR
jgi:hypothetical protein